MRSILSFLALLLIPFVLALPSSTTAFQVSTIDTFEPSGRDNVSVYRIAFNVTDPNDSASTTCEATWPYSERDTGYPTEWFTGCTDNGWAFKVRKYKDVWDFVLDVRHISRVPSGSKTRRLGKGKVKEGSNLSCVHAGSGSSQCRLMNGVTLLLDVYKVVSS